MPRIRLGHKRHEFQNEVIHKGIKGGLPVAINEEAEEKYCNYHTITTKEWIDFFGTLEARDVRRRSFFEAQKSTKK